MIIRPMTEKDLPKTAELYNRLAEVDFVHKKLPLPAFRHTFFEEEILGPVGSPKARTVHKLSFVAEEDESVSTIGAAGNTTGAARVGRILGFASGALVDGRETGYVTFVLTDPAIRQRGVGKALLKALEEALAAKAATPLKDIQMIFFNPVALRWIIPGTKGHDHPNAPGVDVASEAYLFFKNEGYTDRVTQNSYYLPLEKFEMAPELRIKRAELKEKGFAIGYYDPILNPGLEELVQDLGSEDWERELLGNKAKGALADPLIVAIEATDPSKIDTEKLAACPGKVVGFTGPIHVEASGRGYFAGLGVHSAYRGLGLGTLLFSALCQGQKENGAAFMTLFTGETNPARRIYRGAGFRIVHSWSDMIKPLK